MTAIAGQDAINAASAASGKMIRHWTFGALRMLRATMQNDKGKFKAFLLHQGYKEEDLINIKKAFESLKTPDAVSNETVF